jgi:hypothetical protein
LAKELIAGFVWVGEAKSEVPQDRFWLMLPCSGQSSSLNLKNGKDSGIPSMNFEEFDFPSLCSCVGIRRKVGKEAWVFTEQRTLETNGRD